MRKITVNVNGNNYEDEVEEFVQGSNVSENKTASEPLKASAPSKPAASAPVAGGKESITSPMPGTIVDVRVKSGDNVRSGDVLLVLEAMKMENEILAPVDGKVTDVRVSKGASVESGELLIVIG